MTLWIPFSRIRERSVRSQKGRKRGLKSEKIGYFTMATEEESPIPLLLSARNSRKKGRKWQALSVPRESLPSDACITVYCRSPRGRVLGITSFLSAFATATFLPSFGLRFQGCPTKWISFDFPPLPPPPFLSSRIKNESFSSPPSFLHYPHFRKFQFSIVES